VGVVAVLPSSHPSAGQQGARQQLSPAAERGLVAAAEAGDAAACAELVEAFLPAIGGVARLYRNVPGVERGAEQIERLIASARPARGLAEVVGGADGPLGTLEDVLADPGAEGEERALGKLRAAVAPALA
jgi:hypothetical protein